MSRIVAIGEEERLIGYGIAGVVVVPADDSSSVVAAWDGPARGAELVLLTPAAHAALAGRLDDRRVLWEVLP